MPSVPVFEPWLECPVSIEQWNEDKVCTVFVECIGLSMHTEREEMRTGILEERQASLSKRLEVHAW
jgi:hypothetical protein